MLTLILDQCRLPEVEAWPDGAAFFHGITIGVVICAALYGALGLLWWLA